MALSSGRAFFALTAIIAACAGGQLRAATLDLVATCHAIGDGITDDAGALRSCLTALQSQTAAGHPSSLHIPAGVYRITGAAGTLPVLARGATIEGEGPHATTLLLDPTFSGDVFAWDEAWTGRSAGAASIDLASDATGPTIQSLRIVGKRPGIHRQNAIVFYDREDHALIRDVEVDYLTGACLSVGLTRQMPLAYLRESAIFNLKCFSTGAPGDAAVTLSSTARPGSDATNEVDITKLAVFDAPGQGVAIRNPRVGSATRQIRFFGLRVEKTGAEGVAIGDPSDHGQVAGIAIFDLTVIQAHSAALLIASAPNAPQPYNIRIEGGALGPGNTRGIDIESGRLIDVALDMVDAPVILGPHAGTDIAITSNGNQSDWRFAGTKPPGSVATPLELRTPYMLRGFPGAGDRVGVAALRADMPGGMSARLTMDGTPPGAYNCFNPAYAQSFALDIKVLLQDREHAGRYYSWSVPSAVISAWTGPGAARLDQAAPMILAQNAAGASVSMAADRVNGCLNITAHAPSGGIWSATAALSFARAP